ncbi:hypothetical protein [Flavobacterium orientale]|uniref:Uncharacterized protein n=1 Tax=Flavobacterium orientale TaxID=1756020 RepID=A0A917DEF7_9FLAO|nr:hypothetical protein [Flavobacterium orientale]GGD30652.1 hypothetical protein GCM10011343_21020 [Flavobacterium orientale]
MKKLLLILFLTTNMLSYSQDLPTEPAKGFAFPLGTKFTIKLHPTDDADFDYSIIAFEPFQEIIDIWENDTLFNEKGEEGTIEFYFCLGTSGIKEDDKEEDRKVVLVMKNRTKYSLSYKSDIQRNEDGEFKETSNVGTYSGAKGTEMWPYMIYQIGLHDFKIME